MGTILSGQPVISAAIFERSSNIPVEAGLNSYAWATPGINVKFNGVDGFYDKVGIQRASSPDGPFAEKIANPTGLSWSTPNSRVLMINEFGYCKDAAPDQAMTWVRAAPMLNTSQYVDLKSGGRRGGDSLFFG